MAGSSNFLFATFSDLPFRNKPTNSNVNTFRDVYQEHKISYAVQRTAHIYINGCAYRTLSLDKSTIGCRRTV